MEGLDARDYRAALRVVESASRANTLEAFRRATLDAFATELGYRDLTFFVGATAEDAFSDASPAVLGRAGRMLDQYICGYWREDLYARPRALAMFRTEREPSPLSSVEALITTPSLILAAWLSQSSAHQGLVFWSYR